MGVDGKYLNIIKAIYNNPTANITLHGEKLRGFPLRSGIKQGCPFPPLLFSAVLEVLDRAIRLDKEIKESQLGRRKQHCYLLMRPTCIEEIPKSQSKNLLELINSVTWQLQNQRTEIRSSVIPYKLCLRKSSLTNIKTSPSSLAHQDKFRQVLLCK